VKRLAGQDWSHRRMAHQLHRNRRTVIRSCAADELPVKRRSHSTTSSVTPFERRLRQRYEAGCHQGRALWAELRAAGYNGSLSSVYRALKRLGLLLDHPVATAAAPAPLSPRQARWLLLWARVDLSQEEQRLRDQLCEQCPRSLPH
jgi:hypothetical protein